MTLQSLDTDYLVVGSGAVGLAFADELLSQNPSTRVILVDRHAKPGGHWNDAYPYVTLHQPAAYYGVNSEKLGSGGSYLSSGHEILSYFERVLMKWKETGRLQHFPMCEYLGDGKFQSLVAAGQQYQVKVRRKTVDAYYSQVRVPSVTPPAFEVAEGISLIPPNDLVTIDEPKSGYVVIGSGKTGMDAVLFLLNRNVDPDLISWIMPNDAWFLDRARIQPGCMSKGLGTQFGDFAKAECLSELFQHLEASGNVVRLDKDVWPTKYRCATVSLAELDQLRQVRHIIRRGRVIRVEANAIVLQEGRVATDPTTLHINCTADGLARRPSLPVFDSNRITLQSLFLCQPVFSAAVIACVESRFDDQEKMNALCRAVPHPEVPRDFVLCMSVSLANVEGWMRSFGRWMRGSRLFFVHHESTFTLLKDALKQRKLVPTAMAQIQKIQLQEFPELESH